MQYDSNGQIPASIHQIVRITCKTAVQRTKEGIFIPLETLAVFHPDKLWLKLRAPINMPFMFVTLILFQLSNGWLKLVA